MAGSSEYTIAPPPPVEQEQYTIVPPVSAQAATPKPEESAPQPTSEPFHQHPIPTPAQASEIGSDQVRTGNWLLDAMFAPGTFIGHLLQPHKEPSLEEKAQQKMTGVPAFTNLPLIDPSIEMEHGFLKGIVQGVGGLTAPNQVPLALFSPESKAISGIFAVATAPQVYAQYDRYKLLKSQGRDVEAKVVLGEITATAALGSLAAMHATGIAENLATSKAGDVNSQRLALLSSLPPERQLNILKRLGVVPDTVNLEDVMPSMAKAAGGKLQIGADVGRLTEILGSSMYSNRGAPVVVKELLQNALDAVRPNGGGVTASLDRQSRSFLIRDTGVGMTPDEVYSVFTDIGSSGKTKQAGASGGFGLAKIAPFMIPEKMAVETVALDTSTGKKIKTSFTSTPEDIVSGNVSPKVSYVGDSTPTGTQIMTVFPQPKPDESGYTPYDPHNFSDAERFLRNFLGSTNLPTKDISFKSGGTSLAEMREPITEAFSSTGPGGLYTFHLGSKLDKGGNGGYPDYEVHNNGLYQFSTSSGIPGADKVSMPDRIVVDIKPNVQEGAIDYPFTTNREATTQAAKQFIANIIKQKLVDPKMAEVTDLIKAKYNNMPTIPTSSGIEMPLYDSGARLTVNEINTLRNHPAMREIANTIHTVFRTLQRQISDLPASLFGGRDNRPMGSTVDRVGILMADAIEKGGARTYGVYVPDPNNPVNNASVFINPFGWAALSEEGGVYKASEERPDNQFYNPDFAASQLYHTMIHELTHDVVKGHNEAFTTAIMNLDSFLGINSKISGLEDLANAFRDPNDQQSIRRDFDELLQIYSESRKRPENETDILGGESLAAGGKQPPKAGETPPTPPSPERREETLRPDRLFAGRGFSPEGITGLSPLKEGAGGQASEGDSYSILKSILPEFNKIIGGGEGAGAPPSRVESASPYPASEDEPPPPVISRVVDDDLAASGINVVHRGRDINIVSRFLGSFNETARKLEAEGHPLGPILKQMAGIMSDVTKNIAANQTDTLKAFINGAQKLVSRDEWSNQVVNLMDRRVDARPAGTPDHIWNAYQVGRNLDEALRVKILQAKRSELRLNGFDQEQVEKWYPDTWGMAGEHYPHLHPGTWTITKLAEVDEKGNEVYEPISHKDISWRATSEFEAKRNAQAYLADNPGEQLRVRQDTVSLPGSGITDRARLIDLTNKIKEATTTITRAGADPKEVLDDLYDQSAAKAYGPRRAAKRQFGPALQRETNLQGWTRDIEDFKDYLLAGERYTQLAPARQMLMKARNKIAELAGMPQVQKIGDFPSTIKYFSAAQYGNILARVDSAIEGLEGHPGAWDAGARYIASQLGYDPDIVSKLARPVQQVVALLKLGFQPARILSHGLQTGWAVYPVLGEKATLQGMAHSFNPKYADLIHDLAVTHSGNMSDIQGLREYAGAYFGRGSTPIDWTKGTAHILRDIGLLPFTMGIDYTRSVAAVGGYIQGLERGLSEPAARAYARDVMDRTTGIYNAADNPSLLRQLPGPVSQFKGFMLKTMQFMGNLRGAEIPRFAAFVSLMGVVGFPAIKALSNLVELGTGYNPENDLKRKFPVASRGAFGALGVDQPAAVGFADWFASRPGIPLAGLAGPAGSDILNFAKAGMEQARGPSRQAEQDLDLALRQLSPEARRVWDEALRLGSHSPSLIDPRTGSTIINSLTPLERAEAVLGFTPLKVAKERESHEFVRNELEKAKDQRGYFVDKLAENQLELMRPGLTSSEKADLIKDTVSLQKLAIEYNQARNLVPAVRDRIRSMMQERLERDLRKAPKSQRPMIYQEIQRSQQE